MKPTRNRVVCPDCGRAKMLFESKEKAQRFIDFNGKNMKHGDRLRPYYCPACCGYHISHMEYSDEYEGRTERLINEYQKKKQWSKLKINGL
jgi:hypothetical protein